MFSFSLWERSILSESASTSTSTSQTYSTWKLPNMLQIVCMHLFQNVPSVRKDREVKCISVSWILNTFHPEIRYQT